MTTNLPQGKEAQNSGSDFDPIYFSPEENQKWANLLVRMRAFEQAVCRQFRQIETQFVQISSQIQISNTVDRVRELESSLRELENTMEMDTFQTQEKMIDVEQEVGKVNMRMDYQERLTKVRFGKIIEKMKAEVSKVLESLDTLQARVQILEYEQDEEIGRTMWMEDGHSEEHAQLPTNQEENGENNQVQEECEIMISDPFLGGISPLEGYDGNPSVSFSRWVARFEDMLTLYPQYTETQKLSRLRILLKGQARAEFEAMEPPPTSLSVALGHLKSKFENENTRSIARQAMASCRQAPGERVYEFANRLSEAVRTALAGEKEEIIRKRLFEEFLEKLTPELQFEVKSGRPSSYSNAYELAQHFELLLATKRANHVSVADSVAELSHKVEALTIHQQPIPNRRGSERRACYYCKRPGHIVKDCRDKRRDEERRYRGDQRDGHKYFGGERRWSRERNFRDNRNFAPRGRGQRDGRIHRTPTPYGEENGQNFESARRHSPGRRVSFGGRVGAARIASPLFLALIMVISLFGRNSATSQMASPMICHPDSPASLWSIPVDPICPTWSPTEIPVTMKLSVYRLNTIQYKTAATACKCIKTKISRRIGFFGGRYEEVATSPIEMPTATCRKMRENGESPAGQLVQINGIFRATQNSLEVGWRNWPAAMFWRSTEVSNCYAYETVVFTRHGMEGLNTPTNDCPTCAYQSGSCRCPQISLIWKPDLTQRCAYVKIAEWQGEYSSRIWTAESGDFALTFVNISEKTDTNGNDFVISDQTFAVPKVEFVEMLRKSEQANTKLRKKRSHAFINGVRREYVINETDTTVKWLEPDQETKELEKVGLVYSSQLAAQLTALSVKVTANTQKLFAETVHKICTSLRFLADQTLTLAEANPTLLARFFLANPYLTARLVTKDMLEIRPCFAVNERELHFHWKNGRCFERLPVTFRLFGSYEKTKHGFLDPKTLIMHSNARENSCKDFRYLYVQTKGTHSQYDQITGDVKEISSESIHYLSRQGKIDFPEMPIQFFRNKVIANLSELYSPDNFAETVEVAKIAQEIVRLTRPNAWEFTSEKSDHMATNIVSNGLFSFLRGGLISANQMWVFICCCYVSITIIVQVILPAPLAQAMQYLGIGGIILNKLREIGTVQNWRAKAKRGEIKAADKSQAVIQIEEIAMTQAAPKSILKKEPIKEKGESVPVPLIKRWPSPESMPQTPQRTEREETEGRITRGNKNVTIAVAGAGKCDEKFRIVGQANDWGISLLLDTGAHVTLCGKNVALKLGLRKLEASDIVAVIGISDKLIPILGKAEIKLQIAGCAIMTTVYVVETKIGGEGSYDMIIGRSTLRQLPLFLDLQTGALIRKTDGKIFACEMTKECEKAKIAEHDQNLELCLQKHKDVFSTHDYDLGECLIKCPPILTNSNVPERVKPYPVPEKYEKELKLHIGKMLEAGVIKESCTPWAHNVVLVKKSNGQLRPCVDFRPLNKITIPDPYPIPRMDKTILRVAGQKYYSTLDLSSGFWQIPLDSESSYKCGIVTPWGLYQMLKLPFGLRNAPSVFQRTMDKILEGISNVTVYIDDILVHTNSIEEHLKTLELVFARLRKNGLKLKISKCMFLKNKCTYLGHILTEKGYRPSLNNQEVIEAFPEPRNAKEVKRFLGMMSFFRKFIPSFASVASPIQSLVRGKSPEFRWEEPQRKAFLELKGKLLNAPCLRAPNYGLPFYLFTDASAVAYAGALMQTQNGEDLYAVGYWSRTLSTTEAKLPPTHGELAAIVHAVQNFRPIIYGTDLTILTDHRPLTFLFSKASTNPKLNRWLMALQEFEPKVIYVEGKANKIADALSRVPINWDQVEVKSKEEIPFLLMAEESNEITKQRLEKETEMDPILAQVISKIKDNWMEPISEELGPYARERDNLFLEGKTIRKKPGRQILIPQKMQNQILKMLHRAHFGIVRSKARARNIVWWPNLSEEIENYVKNCEICQRNAPNVPRTNPEYKWPEAKFPFERVHMDLAGPIWGTNFLILIDAHSKYPFVCSMQSTHSTSVINYLREIFGMFGSPKCLVTDNGRQFVSEEFENFMSKEGVRHLTTATYHPSSNGEAERFVRTFKEGMTKLLAEGMSAKVAQFTLLQEYRVTPCAAAGAESPAHQFLGRELRTALDKIRMPPNVPEANMDRELAPLQRTGEPEHPQRNQKNFEPGDLIWYKEHTGKWAAGILLQPMGERMWEIQIEGSTVTRSAHVDQIKGRRVGPVRHN